MCHGRTPMDVGNDKQEACHKRMYSREEAQRIGKWKPSMAVVKGCIAGSNFLSWIDSV